MTDIALQPSAAPPATPGEMPALQDGLIRERTLPAALYIGMICIGAAMVLGGLSWASGGVTIITHIGFCFLTAGAVILFIRELARFTQDQAMGSMALFGGVLVWFCHDYFGIWVFGRGEGFEDYTKETVAKAAFYHALFIFCAGLAVRTQGWKWLGDKLGNISEPRSRAAYLPTIILTQILAFLPVALFRVDSISTTIWRMFTSGRAAVNPIFNLEGAGGNLNYSWANYIIRLGEVGQAGAIFATYYALFLARTTVERLLCWLIWTYWLAMGFGSGTRGQIILVTVPAAAFVYFRYQAEAAYWMRKVSARAYVYGLAVLILTFLLTQIQITYRNLGFESMNLKEVEFSRPQGNLMFTESLEGFRRIPAEQPPLWDKSPGMTVLAPLPVEAFFWIIHPIPRPLWNSKPFDPVWHWYNTAVLGETRGESTEGTTIATGLVGHWYIRYGIMGVIEGGLLFGWLLATIQRAFRLSQMRPLTVFLTCSMLMVFFRMFRAFAFADFWSVTIAMFFLWVFLKVLGLMLGHPADLSPDQPHSDAQDSQTAA